MSELGPEVIKIDEFSGREDALELDPARLAPGAAIEFDVEQRGDHYFVTAIRSR